MYFPDGTTKIGVFENNVFKGAYDDSDGKPPRPDQTPNTGKATNSVKSQKKKALAAIDKERNSSAKRREIEMTNRNHPNIIRSSSKDLQESAHPSGDERASMRQTAKNNEMSRHDYND